jgi:PIN domain
MYRPIWSTAILAEVEEFESEKARKRGISEDHARRHTRHLLDQMNSAFDDARVEGWEPLVGSYRLPDPDDEHLVAAAVIGGAGAIVTHNVRHFPPDRLPRGLDILRPADFVHNTVALDSGRSLRAVERMADRSGRLGPRWSVDDVLDYLATKYRMVDAVDLLRQAR